MKKLLLSAVILFSFSGCDTARNILGSVGNSNLSNAEVVQGLKEALKVGTDSSTFHLGLLDGFYKDDMIRILMPPEAQNVEKTLRSIGMGSIVDKAVLSMNRAAEDASKQAAPIFLAAIQKMTIEDALNILKGSDTAATAYLRNATTPKLTAAFRPIVEESLKKVKATKYWNDVFKTYNRFTDKPVETDINSYVTAQALNGLFYYVAQEEANIRENPAARVNDILKKVFAK